MTRYFYSCAQKQNIWNTRHIELLQFYLLPSLQNESLRRAKGDKGSRQYLSELVFFAKIHRSPTYSINNSSKKQHERYYLHINIPGNQFLCALFLFFSHLCVRLLNNCLTSRKWDIFFFWENRSCHEITPRYLLFDILQGKVTAHYLVELGFERLLLANYNSSSSGCLATI